MPLPICCWQTRCHLKASNHLQDFRRPAGQGNLFIIISLEGRLIDTIFLFCGLCIKHLILSSSSAAETTNDAHVIGRANHSPSRSGIGGQHFGDAKISKLQDPPATAENVVALQVSVNDALHTTIIYHILTAKYPKCLYLYGRMASALIHE